MPNAEQKEKLRRLAERRRQREEQRSQPIPQTGLNLAGKYIEPVIQSAPVQAFLEYPRRAAVEEVQRFGEFKEAYDQGGVGGLLGHWGREVGSDVLDIGSDLSRGLIPETWGEQLDPSRNVELGAQVEADKQAFREIEGRNPTMTEEYDIMARVQDEAMPWLTERHKVGPVEFSNRMLVELPTEVGAGVGEAVVTGGTALAAKTTARLGGKATQMAADTLAQQAARNSVRATTEAARQALLIPKRIDDLAGSLITAPFKFVWGVGKGGVAGTRLTLRSLETLVNRFRRKAQEEGLPIDQVTSTAQQAVDDLVKNGKIGDVDSNAKINIHDEMFDEQIDDDTFVPPRQQVQGVDDTLDMTDVTAVRIANSMAGTGTFTGALRRGSFVNVHVDEFDPDIIQAFNAAHGTDFTARNIADDASLQSLISSNAEHYHASPVCKEFSLANPDRVVSENDYAIATSVARNITMTSPKTITIENVPRYKNTLLFKQITDAIDADPIGYNWDVHVINPTDYGGSQHRPRMLLVAVRKDVGELPALPEKTDTTDWYDELEDLIKAEEDAGKAMSLAQAFRPSTRPSHWEIDRIREMIAAKKLNPNRPIFTTGGSGVFGEANARNSGRNLNTGEFIGPQAGPTLIASKGQKPRIILPGPTGLDDPTTKVFNTTPEMWKRYMGLPDDFVIPPPGKYGSYTGNELAKTVLGNGIHGAVTRKFVQPIIDIHQGKRLVDTPDIRTNLSDELTAQQMSANDNTFGVPDIGMTSPGTGFGSKMQQTYQNVRAALDNISVVHATNNLMATANKRLRDKSKLIPELFQLRARTETAEELYEQRLGRESNKEVINWWDGMANRVEAHKTIVREKTELGLLTIKELFPGLLKSNMGGPAARRAAQSVDASDNIVTAQGELAENLLLSEKQGKQINFTFTDDYFIDNNIDRTVLGNTVVDLSTREGQRYQKIVPGDVKKNMRGEDISLTLQPGYREVAERLPLYMDALRSAVVVLDEDLIKRVSKRGGSLFGFKEGDRVSAYDIMSELADIPKRYEEQLIQEGVGGAGKARHVLYDEGAGYQPSNVMGEPVSEDGVFARGLSELELTEVPGEQQWHIKSVKERAMPSQGLGMFFRHVYASPAVANSEYVEYVGNVVRNRKMGQYVSRIASENMKGRYGTVSQLVGEKVYKKYNINLVEIKRLLNNVIRREQRQTGRKENLLAQSTNIISEMETQGKVIPHITSDMGSITRYDLVQTEMKRLDAHLVKWKKDIGSLMTRAKANKTEKERLTKLFNKATRDLAQMEEEATDRMGQLSGIGLEGHYFPLLFRNAIVDAQQAIKRTTDPEGYTKAYMAVNNLLRTYGATGDFSAIGIQGWSTVLNDALRRVVEDPIRKGTGKGQHLLVADRQGDGISALRDSWAAFVHAGPEVVGEFFQIQDALVKQSGNIRATPLEAASSGLAILGNAPDMFLNRRMAQLPGLKNFDRAFTHYGNVLRYQLFDAEMQLRMVDTGKTAKQLIDSGDAAQIASIVNVMTGVGKRGFGGSIGQLLLFAPRFFVARMNFAGNAIKGSSRAALRPFVPGIDKKTPLQQRIARQYMTKMMGTAAVLTFAINEARGEETDISPWTQDQATGKWHHNPNFLRTHIGDLDISFFGPWDTMFRIVATPFVAVQNGLVQGGGVDETLKSLRGLVSGPAASLAMDIASGSDAIGQTTRPPTKQVTRKDGTIITQERNFLESLMSTQTLETMAENLIPFAWDELFRADPGKESLIQRTYGGVQQVGQGELLSGGTDILTAAGQGLGQLFGIKSSYESLNETLDEVYASVLELGPSNIDLQEAFSMSESELAEYLKGVGQGGWNDGRGFDISLSIRRLVSGNQTPSFSDVASDYRKNIKRMTEEGRFSDILSPEDWEKAKAKIDEKVQNSASVYTRYKAERDRLLVEEQNALQAAEDEYIARGMTKTSTYYMEIQKIRKAQSEKRRALTGPQGAYRGVGELFTFGRESSLGILSNADVDIYDFAQASYYDKLYGEDSIIDQVTSDVDWDKRDRKLEEWAGDMKKRFKTLQDSDIASYLLRVQQSAKKDAPPLAGAMLEMSDRISRSGYYEVEKNYIVERLKAYPGQAQETMELYSEWKNLSPEDRKRMEDKNQLLATLLGNARVRKLEFRAANPEIDAMLQVIGRHDTAPVSRLGQGVQGIMLQTERRPVDMATTLAFFGDILSEDVDLKKLYKYYQP